uniref:CXXC-type domain-containing protein n=1 Tax=Glossina brevipalpis TaxID=37001 RepID=A0A1A9W5Y6_9MUSC
MASSIATQSSSGTQETSANTLQQSLNHHHHQQHQQQQQQHITSATEANQLHSSNSYTRPWEMESKDNSNSNNSSSTPKSGFEPFSKLPSFQSQFHGYTEQLMADGTPLPTGSSISSATATAGLTSAMSSLQTVAMSPASMSVSSPGMVSMGSPLTQLTGLQTSITPPSSSFAALGAPMPHNAFHSHALGAAHHRTPYPLMPAALQARDIVSTTLPNSTITTAGYGDPLLYQPLTPSYASATPTSLAVPSAITPTVSGSSAIGKKDVTISAFDLNTNSNASQLSAPTSNTPNTVTTPLGMHTPTPSYDGASSSSLMDISNGTGTGAGYHTPHSTHTNASSTGSHTPHTTQPHTPTPSTTSIKPEKVLNSPVVRVDARKKERRKNRAHSLESNAESEASAMDLDPSNPGQVDAVSSTANFKSPIGSMNVVDGNESAGDKQTSMNSTSVLFQSKKKRKRCGECIGCQRKDNCGECAPCRNDKSHQICKQRRCEKLTEKKLTPPFFVDCPKDMNLLCNKVVLLQQF